jgi:uncharacterized protein YgbK (DUF1537 family)
MTQHLSDAHPGCALAVPAATISDVPPAWAEDLQPTIRERVAASARTIVVLDDDPTGTQTVYDTPLLTEWSVPVLRREFQRQTPLVFILTNSRSESPARAEQLNTEIARNLLAARQATRREFTVISRSDSTLRGHFPLEIDALSDTLDLPDAVRLLVPFFAEGGRLTFDDVHYVVENDCWLPVGETPFAQDHMFGFQSSDLKDWIEERTGGRIPAADVTSIDLTTIRTQGPAGVHACLSRVGDGGYCVVNALEIADLEVVVAAVLDAEEEGRRFLCRTAASFVRARAGLAARPLLEAATFTANGAPTHTGGLVVVGSHVPKTTAQLDYLFRHSSLERLEVDVAMMRSEAAAREQMDRLRRRAEVLLARGRSCVVYTSRELVCGHTGEEYRRLGRTITQGLARLVRELRVRPRFLLAKGGTTAHEIATRGIGIRRALVMGQLLPGVPVWQAGFESTLPDRYFVVFPGNVGGTEALWEAVEILSPDGGA